MKEWERQERTKEKKLNERPHQTHEEGKSTRRGRLFSWSGVSSVRKRDREKGTKNSNTTNRYEHPEACMTLICVSVQISEASLNHG
jgi:hypothetical protein